MTTLQCTCILIHTQYALDSSSQDFNYRVRLHDTITLIRVANSHAYGVILTHLTCYSRTHAIDKFTHAFKRNHTHTHAFYKI